MAVWGHILFALLLSSFISNKYYKVARAGCVTGRPTECVKSQKLTVYLILQNNYR
jgi:hypothetical protein